MRLVVPENPAIIPSSTIYIEQLLPPLPQHLNNQMSRELGCCFQTEVRVPWVYFSLMDMHAAQYSLGAQQPGTEP